MEKKLNEFAVGEEGIVKRIEGEGRIRRRLFDMGVTPGAQIMLRKAEAACVVMEVKNA